MVDGISRRALRLLTTRYNRLLERLTTKQNAGPGNHTPSIFFVTLPKSGTVFTWENLVAVTGLKSTIPDLTGEKEKWDLYWTGIEFVSDRFYGVGDFTSQLLIPDRMRPYLPCGYVFGAHMLASYHNVKSLEAAGITRATVLLRDPRDACVSWTYHLQKMGPVARDYHSKIYHIPAEYYVWPFGKQLSYQVRTFLPMAVNWIESWLWYYRQADRKLEILLVYFDELKRRPEDYFTKIARFHGCEHIDLEKLEYPEEGKRHFRRGEHFQWREEFSPDDLEFTERLVGTRLQNEMNEASLCHVSWPRALERLKKGDPEASQDFLDVLRQFPNFGPAYNGLFDSVKVLGTEVEPTLADRVSSVLAQSAQSPFIYQFELLESCAALVKEAKLKFSKQV